MKKKSIDWIKFIPIAITVIGLAIGGILGWANFKAMAENTKVKVDELKADVKELAAEGDKKIEELKDKSKETDKKVEVNKTQQDNIQAQVQQVSEKTDKIYDVLLELKNKKK